MSRVARALRSLIRNGALRRIAFAWLMFLLAEYAVWIGMLVYAYGQGGSSTAGVVAVAQLIPGVLLAPFLATLADRYPPAYLLAGGYLVQTIGMAGTAAFVFSGGPPIGAYVSAVVASTAVVSTRPAQSTLVPAVAASGDELTAANAVFSWLDSLGIVAAGLLTGVALSVGSPGLVFAICAGCTGLGALATVGIRAPAIAAVEDDPDAEAVGAFRAVGDGLAVLRKQPASRVLVSIITAQYVVIGAFDVLFVVVVAQVLRVGSEWTGYLNTAYGLGGVAAGVVTIALLGRRLARPLLAAVLVVSAGLALLSLAHDTVLAAVLVAAAGTGRIVIDTATRSLLQRTVPSVLLGRIFGVVEALSGLGLAIGSMLVPALIGLGGPDTAILGTAVVLPLVALLGGRVLLHLDDAAHVPVAEIALLRAMPHFRALPAPELEGLAQALERRSFAAGETIIQQGDRGDSFFAIGEGEVSVLIDGVEVATRQRPDGLGEIALLRRVPRSATVVARTDTVLYELDGETFLAVVTGHESTRRRADAVAAERIGAPRGRPMPYPRP